jgi:hypothetical protein
MACRCEGKSRIMRRARAERDMLTPEGPHPYGKIAPDPDRPMRKPASTSHA